jgi:hypothetical protein
MHTTYRLSKAQRHFFFLFALLCSPMLRAQMPDTDIWLFDLNESKGHFTFSKPLNITNRPGYDNQPAFSPDGKYILYTSYRENGQSDIYKYTFHSKTTTAFCSTPESEYSPVFSPDEKFVSVVRVEKDSAQRLWKFPLNGASPVLLFKNIDSIGYHSWMDSTHVLLFILGTPPSKLHDTDMPGTPEKLIEQNIHHDSKNDLELVINNPGRSLRNKYFVNKTDTAHWEIDQARLGFHRLYKIAPTLKGKEDFDIYQNQIILMGTGSKIYAYTIELGVSNPFDPDKVIFHEWQLAADLADSGIKNISRIAISRDGKKIAVVSTN